MPCSASLLWLLIQRVRWGMRRLGGLTRIGGLHCKWCKRSIMAKIGGEGLFRKSGERSVCPRISCPPWLVLLRIVHDARDLESLLLGGASNPTVEVEGGAPSTA